LGDEAIEPIGQDVGGDAKAFLQSIEAPNTEEHLAHHEERPTIR
jgi:hypothetical protein